MKSSILCLSLVLLLLIAAPLSAKDAAFDGEKLFNARCGSCHGVKGAGTGKGPPLVHRIYEPNHHADITFRWAVERGVKAHHWNFGDMPKLDGVKLEEVEAIIKYVRDTQKEAGIY
ncbi:MAG: cytochrome c [Deltaproteobacteria bacterium]|nr:cytochrome c [Deltaproteobacteria bacterium]